MNQTNEIHLTGPAWASVLAAAIGCATFSLLTDITEASNRASQFLNFYNPTGDLSGKSTIAVIVWLASWAVLYLCWKGKTIECAGWVTTLVLFLLLYSLVATFPPFFGLFASH